MNFFDALERLHRFSEGIKQKSQDVSENTGQVEKGLNETSQEFSRVNDLITMISREFGSFTELIENLNSIGQENHSQLLQLEKEISKFKIN